VHQVPVILLHAGQEGRQLLIDALRVQLPDLKKGFIEVVELPGSQIKDKEGRKAPFSNLPKDVSVRYTSRKRHKDWLDKVDTSSEAYLDQKSFSRG
jgi:hypothetical protein